MTYSVFDAGPRFGQASQAKAAEDHRSWAAAQSGRDDSLIIEGEFEVVEPCPALPSPGTEP